MKFPIEAMLSEQLGASRAFCSGTYSGCVAKNVLDARIVVSLVPSHHGRQLLRAKGGPALPGLFLPEQVEADNVICFLSDADLFGYAPGERLLVKRDVRHVVLQQTEGLCDHIVPFRRVWLDQDLACELIDRWIAVSTQIELALPLFVATSHEIVQDIPGVEGSGRPTEQVK
jgi:hypothetical protein